MEKRRIKDIENLLERADAINERDLLIEIAEQKISKRERAVKICAGIGAILCAAYAIYMNI